MKKYLIIRFSSIGDIVLTSPVVRCLKTEEPESEIHYLTKKAYEAILLSNPYISKCYTITKDIDEVVKALKEEQYDFVIDLHNNLRTYRLKQKLRSISASFPKLNWEKFLLTTFKWNTLPDIHIVDRYFKATESLGVKNDDKGLDFFIPAEDQVNLAEFAIPERFVALSIGAQYATKRLPEEQLLELSLKIKTPIVLLGGEADREVGEYISGKNNRAINLCAELRLNQSASVLEQAEKVVTHDTGLMHIASAFNKNIISIWGNTVPELGMYPYLPEQPEQFSIHEVKLKCRPCSKIGHQKCPKKHFDCMLKQDLNAIAEKVNVGEK